MLRAVLKHQVKMSATLDRWLTPSDMRVNGSGYFREFVRDLVKPGDEVWDVGSGRYPCFSAEEKRRLGLYVVGMDIDGGELSAAPAGSYDEIVVADITSFKGAARADIVVSHAVMEHVKGTTQAFEAIASMVEPGGKVALFVPSRNALFARLNLIIPQGLKRWLLDNHPEKKRGAHGGGWRAYYDQCTPRGFERLAVQSGLQVVRVMPFYISTYFMVFTPAFVLWRLWMLGFRALMGREAAETFCMELRRPAV